MFFFYFIHINIDYWVGKNINWLNGSSLPLEKYKIVLRVLEHNHFQ